MGTIISYVCPGCGYDAAVAGGRTCGYFIVVETILCRDCKELYDARAREKPQEPHGDSLPQESQTQVRSLAPPLAVSQVWRDDDSERFSTALGLISRIGKPRRRERDIVDAIIEITIEAPLERGQKYVQIILDLNQPTRSYRSKIRSDEINGRHNINFLS